MTTYILRRLAHSAILLFAIATVVFLMIHILPGDPATAILGGEDRTPSQEQIDQVREQLGLDRPLYVQYAQWWINLAQLDLGTAFGTNRPVTQTLLVERLPRSLMIGIPSLIVAVALGIPLGIVGAQLRRTMWDPIISAVALLGFSIPVFVIGLVMVLVFAVGLSWLPSGGYVSPLDDVTGFVRAATLPTLALAMGPLAVVMRMTRSSVLEQMGLDYVRTARAKGLAPYPVLLKHVLRNSLLPVVTVVGLQLGSVFSGSVIVEFIFNWPGIGRVLLQAVIERDYPVIQGVMLIVAAMFVIINLITDIIYGILDPRIRYR